MNRALLELLALSVRGRLRRTARLLRQPRYLVGALAGLAYFAFITLPWLTGGEARVPEEIAALAAADTGPWVEGLALVASLGLALLLTGTWLFTPARPFLSLTEGELHTLLAAPVRRRELLAYGVLKSQLSVLLTAAVFTALAGFSPRTFAAYWLLVTLADLHIKGVGLAEIRLGELPPRRAAARRIALYGAMALFWMAVLWGLQGVVRGFFEAGLPETLNGFGERLAAALQTAEGRLVSTLTSVLEPAVAPLLPGTGWIGWLLALLYGALHAAWVLTSKARFEEIALARARDARTPGGGGYRAASRRYAAASARRRQPFSLAGPGRPELGVVWKHLLGVTRRPLGQILAAGAGLLVAFAAILLALPLETEARRAVTFLTLLVSSLLAIFLPTAAGVLFRQDLRHDLVHVEAVRTWPLAPRQLVAAQAATPVLLTVLLSAFGCGLAWTGLATATWLGLEGFTAGRLLGASVLLVALWLAGVGLAAYSSALQNLATLLFPSWIPLGRDPQTAGPAATGRWVLVALGHLVGLVLGALAPAAAVALLGLVGALALGPANLLEGAGPSLVWPDLAWAGLVLAAGLAAGALFLAEAAALIALAGRRWEGLDPSRELLGDA